METLSNEFLGILRHSLKQLCWEVKGGGGDVPQGLLVGLPTKGREASQQDVGQDTEGPDVCCQTDWLVGKDLWRCELEEG